MSSASIPIRPSTVLHPAPANDVPASASGSCRFDLVQERELAPLQGLIEKLLQSDRGKANGVGRSKDINATA